MAWAHFRSGSGGDEGLKWSRASFILGHGLDSAGGSERVSNERRLNEQTVCAPSGLAQVSGGSVARAARTHGDVVGQIDDGERETKVRVCWIDQLDAIISGSALVCM